MGGVIGGLLAVAIISYLVWKYFVKPRRAQYEAEPWNDDAESTEKDFTMNRDARASTHTVGSIASTVLTRASNIIQIAYIPGVTNRSAPATPGLLVPPVPPIPIALSDSGSPRTYEHEHFFMPGDLRGSTYSAATDRTSYARNSVASTIYGKNAVVSPVIPQTVIRGKAAVVSVKSAANGSPLDTPPVPNIDVNKYSVANNGPPSPAFSVGATFLNSASAATQATATQMRPQVVKVATIGPKKKVSSTPLESFKEDPSDSTSAPDFPQPPTEQGPFADPFRNGSSSTHKSNGSLSAIIDEAEATKRANSEASLLSKKTPFGDENEVKE